MVGTVSAFTVFVINPGLFLFIRVSDGLKPIDKSEPWILDISEKF
jgi:hypothetical protein